MKVGIIRCMKTEKNCVGTGDFKTICAKKGVFEGVDEDIEVIGFANCGGCSENLAPARAAKMVEKGADTIAFSTCVNHDLPGKPACARFEQMRKDVADTVGENIKILGYTHNL